MAIEEKQLSIADNQINKELQALLDAELETALENIDPRPPRIKLSRETPVFLLPDGSTTKEIKGIIVYHHKARGYWEKEGQQAPTCSSLDGKTGIDENGEEHVCYKCPKNVFGSGKDGHGKACKEMRWVYILQPGEIIPSRISLPPTSLATFDTFVTALAQKKIAPIQKIVTLRLETAESRGFKYSTLAQPEISGDTPFKDIPELIRMREAVVAAAKRAGIDAEDYYADAVDAEIADDSEPF